MAGLYRSSSNWMLTVKVLLISIGVVSMAVAVKLIVPLLLEFAVTGVPGIRSSVHAWLKPPYLYIFINGIIITIAASSRICYKLDDEDHSQSQTQPEPLAMVVENSQTGEIFPVFDYGVKTVSEISMDYSPVEITPVVYEQSEVRVSDLANVSVVKKLDLDDEDEYVISRSNWSPKKRIHLSNISSENLLPAEKPLVSARFNHRKSAKASPEGAKALKVTKPKRQETFENTWKTITDGRPMPLTRHLRKSDTIENHGRQINDLPSDRKMNKSETFKDRTNNPSPPVTSSPITGKLRKEASLSQDDLNRRVEAFIKKFNAEMRMQRQESLNQYKEMINRDAY